MSIFQNPVAIEMGRGAFQKVASLVEGKTCIIFASPGTVKRGVIDSLVAELGDRVLAVYSEIDPNPTVLAVTKAVEKLQGLTPEAFIAIGGGSVLDFTKGVASVFGMDEKPQWFSKHLREGAPLTLSFLPPEIIAIPSTSGTGSEVTMWGTIWDEKTGKKYSISHPLLYPEWAVLDPALTLTVPEDTTVSTALDALSHAMEAIWNRNHNPVSDALGMRAIGMIPKALKAVLKNSSDMTAREDLQNASLFAGLSSSGTKTAIAHSMSYPLTSEFDVPHGYACSFALAEILVLNASSEEGLARVNLIVEALGCTSVEEAASSLHGFFKDIGLAKRLQATISGVNKIDEIQGNLIHPDRAINNFVMIDHEQAKALLQNSVRHLLMERKRH
jgi:alcohol dehydrogenase